MNGINVLSGPRLGTWVGIHNIISRIFAVSGTFRCHLSALISSLLKLRKKGSGLTYLFVSCDLYPFGGSEAG